MKIEILHVSDCPHTGVLTDRLATLIASRHDVVLSQQVIHDAAQAAAHGMTGSPTLLVDGADPFAGAAAAPSLSCRLYRDETGALSGAPSLAQLRTALASGAGR